MTCSRSVRVVLTAVLSTGGLGLATVVKGTTLVWDGGATGNNLSRPLNWDLDVAPAANDVLVFPDLTYDATNTPTNNLGSLALGGLVFQEDTTVLSFGSSFTFDGTLVNGATVTVTNAANVNLNGGILQSNPASDLVFNLTGGGNLRLAPITNAANVVKNGAGTGVLVLDSPLNAYTGSTIINDGVVRLGDSNVLPDSTNLVMAGGTLRTGGFSDTLGKLDLDATTEKVINLAEAGGLVFADSADQEWRGTLAIWNWNDSVTSLRFGLTAGGLTPSQLARISVYDGTASGTYLGTAALDADGFLVVVPEPGAVLAGAALLGLIGWRERRLFLRVRGEAA